MDTNWPTLSQIRKSPRGLFLTRQLQSTHGVSTCLTTMCSSLFPNNEVITQGRARAESPCGEDECLLTFDAAIPELLVRYLPGDVTVLFVRDSEP